MSDTPLTDAAFFKLGASMCSLAEAMKQLERENAALRVELEQQALLNGKGAEREAALQAAQDQLVMAATMAKAYLEQRRYGHGIEDPLWHVAKKAIAAARKEQP